MVRYYRMTTGKNTGIAVVFGEWPDRVLKHRGWTPERCVCERVATESEHEWLAGCMRHQAYRYPTIEGLLADEAKILGLDALSCIAAALQQDFHNVTQSQNRPIENWGPTVLMTNNSPVLSEPGGNKGH